MAENNKKRLPHLLVNNTASTARYTSPVSGRVDRLKTPPRNRVEHANSLLRQFEAASDEGAVVLAEQKAFGLDVGNGIYLSFESEPDFGIKFESLEFERSGIELCAVKQIAGKTTATVFVPEGKLGYFLNKLTRYRDEDTTPKSADKEPKPKEQALVEGISAIKLAALEELYTDDPNLFPEGGEIIWWEVWLRKPAETDVESFLRRHAPEFDIDISPHAIRFLDRTVVLVRASKFQLAKSVRVLSSIAEVRYAKETADFFTAMGRLEQHEWINEALTRLVPPPPDAPSVCVIDTGLNNGHPLLAPVAATQDLHTVEDAWGADDRHGHGTNMAGLAAYGDLTGALETRQQLVLKHRLESVKLIPAPNHHEDAQLYGAITREAMARAMIGAPERPRAYCMAVTTTDGRDRGRPSSWSATIDALTSGQEDDDRKLVILSAGNTDPTQRHLYPDSNFTDEVHDPGQSWNALTVGGYTEKDDLDKRKYPGWAIVAKRGGLAPASCTSMEWAKSWPIKPDIVMEAGNMAISPNDNSADYIDDALQLLSTGHQYGVGKHLVSFGDTSAASALAARLAARVRAQYPEFWPETVRALMVHSAEWSQAMRDSLLPERPKQEDYRRLLRFCGYGVPDERALFWSASNRLTLITQEKLQPFYKDSEDHRLKTRDIHLHELPWPIELLEGLGEASVEMRVTLSYFVEPNPGERGWANKYRYASHGLRFSVRRPLESVEQFKQRINKAARDEEYLGGASQDSNWILGEKLRSVGSIHSDTWQGTAAELAARGHLAVYPVVGWWKQRPRLERWARQAPYALVVSIRAPEVDTDIYTAVANQIAVSVQI